MSTGRSDDILDTVENFLDTCPALERVDIKFGGRQAREFGTARTMTVWLDGVKYLVTVRKATTR